VGDRPHVQLVAEALGEGERIALDDEVEILGFGDAEERVADGSPDEADRHVEVGQRPEEQRVRLHRRRDPRRIVGVSYDPLSDKLREAAPVAMPELLELLASFEGLTLTELQDAFAACEQRFRDWVQDPANAGRPISESPDYLDRIALDSLIERRMWWE
jgi:hypothetical protein